MIEEYDDTPTDFGRVAAMTARQVILQRLRDAEHDRTYGEYSGSRGRHRHRRGPGRRPGGRARVWSSSTSARSRRSCRSPSRCRARSTPHGTRLKCYVVGVTRGMRGPQVTVSRTHPSLVKKLFALEVPEIADGSVEIVGVAREAGHRSKIAVRTAVPGLNAKGACIGPMGQRVRNVVAELHGEKIDIIDWAEDPATLRR